MTLRRRFFRSFGIGAFEFLRAWWGPLGRVPAHSRIEGIEHFDAARAAGRGVILLSGHFLPFEMCGRLLTTRTPCAAMYRPYANPAFEWAVKRGRMRYAAAMYGREELRGAVRFLRGGGGLWYAPDQDMRGRDTVFAPFFGVPANTITGTSQLARLSGAAVLPFFHRRSDDGRGYVIRIEARARRLPLRRPRSRRHPHQRAGRAHGARGPRPVPVAAPPLQAPAAGRRAGLLTRPCITHTRHAL